MHGDLVMVYKNKQGERLIDEAIDIGVKGYTRHFPDCTKDDLVAYVSPRLYEELDMACKNHVVPIGSNIIVPYPGVWICPKECDDVR